MPDVAFDAITRRASLLGLSAAGLAGLAAPAIGRAKKKKREKKKFDVNKRCKPQVAQCEALPPIECGDNAECIAAVNACCQKLATCDFPGLIACLDTIEIPAVARHSGG